MTGSGGWPMSMFLTPDLKPFYGATYIPPKSRYGMSGFEDLIHQIEDIWKTRRDEANETGGKIIEHIREASENEISQNELNPEMLLKGAQQFKNGFDEEYGGFGGAPKFPRPVGLNFLLRAYKRFDDTESLQMVIRTLLQMARGGVYDHLGGGFHRYSVDRFWRVPHFEKMLYDQAQLVVTFIEAYQTTGDKFFAEYAENTLNYVASKMTAPEGGFYSAEDAESIVENKEPHDAESNEEEVHKEEGAYYVWEKKEIDEILGGDSDVFCYYFGVFENGNAPAGSDPHNVFNEKNILYIPHSLSETANKFEKSTDEISNIIEYGKNELFLKREKRPAPHLDDKILTSWNGLMISAFAKAYQVFGEREYLVKAINAVQFILDRLYVEPSNTLLHRYKSGSIENATVSKFPDTVENHEIFNGLYDEVSKTFSKMMGTSLSQHAGVSRFEGTLEDYAYFIQGLIDLYEAGFEEQYLEKAVVLCESMIKYFYDHEKFGFFDTSGRDSSILLKTKEDYDSAEPTGNSIAILNLLRLSQILAKEEWFDIAYKSIRLFSAKISSQPYAMPQMLSALDFATNKPKQIVISGKHDSHEVHEMLLEIHKRFIPNKVLILTEGDTELLKPWQIYKSDVPTAYVCENYACKLPVRTREELGKLLDEA